MRIGSALCLFALALELAGCAPISASSKGRMIQYVAGTTKADAFRKADKVCNAYGRVATVVSFDTVRGMAFRCVEA
jgi:hypothetical protein